LAASVRKFGGLGESTTYPQSGKQQLIARVVDIQFGEAAGNPTSRK
jgi:hypothetical protein